MFNEVVLDKESCKIVENIANYTGEMSRKQLEFLCGLIRMYKPQKLVEIGVSGGGTTTVIMNCLKQINNSAVMYSLDRKESWYKDSNKRTGYQLYEAEGLLSNIDRHKMILGYLLPQVIDNIGKNIDFVILDTMHIVPGEILDFLCILPYLKDKAVIVFHDITLGFYNPKAIATQILLYAITGKKYWMNNQDIDIANIAAIEISLDTKRQIANVFATLMSPWGYMPAKDELMLYLEIYERYYDNECVQLFCKACKLHEELDFIHERQEINRICEYIFMALEKWGKDCINI